MDISRLPSWLSVKKSREIVETYDFFLTKININSERIC